jgi:hypothetical protein
VLILDDETRRLRRDRAGEEGGEKKESKKHGHYEITAVGFTSLLRVMAFLGKLQPW